MPFALTPKSQNAINHSLTISITSFKDAAAPYDAGSLGHSHTIGHALREPRRPCHGLRETKGRVFFVPRSSRKRNQASVVEETIWRLMNVYAQGASLV